MKVEICIELKCMYYLTELYDGRDMYIIWVYVLSDRTIWWYRYVKNWSVCTVWQNYMMVQICTELHCVYCLTELYDTRDMYRIAVYEPSDRTIWWQRYVYNLSVCTVWQNYMMVEICIELEWSRMCCVHGFCYCMLFYVNIIGSTVSSYVCRDYMYMYT